MDWAEKLALEIILPHVECEIDTEETCRRLSTALRKAKAEGYRLGLEVSLTTIRDMHEQTIDCLDCLTDELRANAIEKGTG